MTRRAPGRPRDYPELARLVTAGWAEVGPGRNWRGVEAWLRQDPRREDVWKRHVRRMGYPAARQFIIDYCPTPENYPFSIRPTEAVAIVGQGATVVRPTDVVYRMAPGPGSQPGALRVLQTILSVDPDATLNYRAGTIVCEVRNPEDCRSRLRDST
jgi:hypothetical protein